MIGTPQMQSASTPAGRLCSLLRTTYQPTTCSHLLKPNDVCWCAFVRCTNFGWTTAVRILYPMGSPDRCLDSLRSGDALAHKAGHVDGVAPSFTEATLKRIDVSRNTGERRRENKNRSCRTAWSRRGGNRQKTQQCIFCLSSVGRDAPRSNHSGIL